MTVFKQNIEFLCRRFPGFEVDIVERYGPSERLIPYPTPSGYPTATIEGLFLHSRHNPAEEGRRLAECSLTGDEDCIILEGIGLGYTAEAVAAAAPQTPLIIIEPDPALFLEILSIRDLRALFVPENVSILLGVDPDLLVSLLSRAHYGSLKLIRDRALSRLYGDYFDRVERAVSSYLARRDVNRNTLRRFARVWVRNLVRNLPVMASSLGIDLLTDRFKGLPALLIAAGPSVEEVLPLIEKLRRRFVIAAVDTSAALLTSVGIDPDILVVVDPQYWNTRHLDGFAATKTMLISESSTHPRVFHILDLPVIFGGSIFPLGQFLENFTGIRGKLGAGGSVATSAWDVLRQAGCGEIFCAGLDLGFPDGKTHAGGCFFESRLHTMSTRLVPAENGDYHAVHDADPFPEKNNSGTKTLTDHRLIIYKWWFEGQLKSYKDTRTYNLSEKGIRIEGMDYRDPEGLLSYPDRRAEIDGRLESLLSSADKNPEPPESLSSGITELSSTLQTLMNLADRGLDTLKIILNKQESGIDITDELSLLDGIDAQILSSGTKDIIAFLMQDFIGRVTSGDGSGSPLDDSAVMYEGLREAAAYHLELLSEARGM